MAGHPSTPSPAVDRTAIHGPGLTDVRMMIVVHKCFRREIGLGPHEIRATPDGDRQRAAQVTDHLELFLGFLHHHHTNEDELLWDKLLERVPDELSPLVHLMESQHERVHDLLEQLAPMLAGWRTTASKADGEQVAAVLDELCAALFAHLHAEETHLLPIMARTITEAEWNEFDDRGMASIPKDLQLVAIGHMFYEGDPEVMKIQLKKAPAPAPMRPLLVLMARRAFRKYAVRVHGTATPPKNFGVTT